MPIWNPEFETMRRPDLEDLQARRLQTTVAWAYERVAHYRAEMDARGVTPKDIKRLEDGFPEWKAAGLPIGMTGDSSLP